MVLKMAAAILKLWGKAKTLRGWQIKKISWEFYLEFWLLFPNSLSVPDMLKCDMSFIVLCTEC